MMSSSTYTGLIFQLLRRPPRHTLFPCTTLFRSARAGAGGSRGSAGRRTGGGTRRGRKGGCASAGGGGGARPRREDRKSTRLNSSHSQISYAVVCLKKKK